MIIIHHHFDPCSFFSFVTTEVLTFASKTHFVCVRVSKRLGNAGQEAPWCSLTAEGLWKWRLSVSLTITAAGKHIQDKTGSDFHLFNHLSFIIKHSPHQSLLYLFCLPPLVSYCSLFLPLSPPSISFLIFLFFCPIFPFPLSPHITPLFSASHLSLLTSPLIFHLPLRFHYNVQSVSFNHLYGFLSDCMPACAAVKGQVGTPQSHEATSAAVAE